MWLPDSFSSWIMLLIFFITSSRSMRFVSTTMTSMFYFSRKAFTLSAFS
jgi:hypothetical protein